MAYVFRGCLARRRRPLPRSQIQRGNLVPRLHAPKLVIWGASGHALVVADAIRSRGEYEIAGFIDDVHPSETANNFPAPVILGGREQLDLLLHQGINKLIIGFGNWRSRLELADFTAAKALSLPLSSIPRRSWPLMLLCAQGQ